jgi:hypothetical protein
MCRCRVILVAFLNGKSDGRKFPRSILLLLLLSAQRYHLYVDSRMHFRFPLKVNVYAILNNCIGKCILTRSLVFEKVSLLLLSFETQALCAN